MWDMILYDLKETVYLYLPYALGSGIVALCIYGLIRKLSIWWKGNRQPEYHTSIVLKFIIVYFSYIYLFFLVCLTVTSREPGSRTDVDLMPLATFSDNWQNNVYPVENILLFIPLGILLPSLFRVFHKFYCTLLAGAILSLTVEMVQLITERGYFQTDDILTNIMGTLIGFIIFKTIRVLIV